MAAPAAHEGHESDGDCTDEEADLEAFVREERTDTGGTRQDSRAGAMNRTKS